MNKNILLLTSTIKPKSNQPQLKLTNYLDRLEDYKAALTFYSKLLEIGAIDNIIYVDNSGFDLSCHSEIFTNKNIEWISFYDLDYPSAYHRGYGESRLVDYAFRQSKILNQLDASDKVWRITGRYIIKNLDEIIRFTPNDFDFYCNLRGEWIDMELLAWSLKGYKYFMENIWKLMETGKATELILAEVVKGYQGHELKMIKTYFWLPYIIGRRGTDGGSFQGCFTQYKFLLQQMAKLLVWPLRTLLYFLRSALI
ncbi:MAG: hypothetical protein ACXW11_04465 [Methylotenera sp.]